jgi:murein peptide amidase A
MQKLGRNHGEYRGETIDIRQVLTAVDAAAARCGWQRRVLGRQAEFDLVLFQRRGAVGGKRLYVSAGIHGDEPAAPLAALRLLEAEDWPEGLEICLVPCLNPVGFRLNRRFNAAGVDLNRDYRAPKTPEIRAHVAWLDGAGHFDLALCLHEDWESHGFYLYELNPEDRPSLAAGILAAVERVCPIDRQEVIEGRPAVGGVIRPAVVPLERPDWPEAFFLITHNTRRSYTFEAPSDFPLATRVEALVAGTRAAVQALAAEP